MPRRKKLKKPSEILEIYGRELIEGLEKRLSPSAFELNYSFRSPKVAYISGFVVFRNGYLLEFDEIIKQKDNNVDKLKYRYHVMDKEKNLILRYDNAPHHPKIKTHPRHKHLPDKVVESEKPNLLELVEEVESLVIKNL